MGWFSIACYIRSFTTPGLFENTVNKPKALYLPKKEVVVSQVNSLDSPLTDQLFVDDKLASTRYCWEEHGEQRYGLRSAVC